MKNGKQLRRRIKTGFAYEARYSSLRPFNDILRKEYTLFGALEHVAIPENLFRYLTCQQFIAFCRNHFAGRLSICAMVLIHSVASFQQQILLMLQGISLGSIKKRKRYQYPAYPVDIGNLPLSVKKNIICR